MRVAPFIITLLALWLTTDSSLVSAQTSANDVVKQSRSGICHTPSSPYYHRTKRFTAYPNLKDCLADGGRLPKGYKPAASARSDEVKAYQRSAFGRWKDDDDDCMNTRHELLARLSSVAVTLSPDGCRVVRGHWLDPYTGRTFLSADDLDVDHLVPLKWAWTHGADRWDRAQRERFANDPINLFAVDDSTNRRKGAQGPMDWLPPNQAFQCQYLTRFQRVLRIYSFQAAARQRIDAQRQRVCAETTVAER